MLQLDSDPSKRTIQTGLDSLQGCDYPGRLVVVGRSKAGKMAIRVCALSGRSEGSRNRVYDVNEDDEVRTVAPDMTEEQMAAVKNAELIYYKAMVDQNGIYVAANGAQSEPVLRRLIDGYSLDTAVKTAPTVDGIDLSMFEPDSNRTPRITGSFDLGPERSPFGLSIVRKDPLSNLAWPLYSTYTGADLRSLKPGVGYAIQTYNHGAPEGELLPSFDREPYAIPLGETAEEIAHRIWDLVNREVRVAVVASSTDLNDGETQYSTVDSSGQSSF